MNYSYDQLAPRIRVKITAVGAGRGANDIVSERAALRILLADKSRMRGGMRLPDDLRQRDATPGSTKELRITVGLLELLDFQIAPGYVFG